MTFAEDMTAKERSDFERVITFGTAAFEAVKDKPRGKLTEFCCPVCKGTAFAAISEYNEHLSARCDGCGMIIME